MTEQNLDPSELDVLKEHLMVERVTALNDSLKEMLGDNEDCVLKVSLAPDDRGSKHLRLEFTGVDANDVNNSIAILGEFFNEGVENLPEEDLPIGIEVDSASGSACFDFYKMSPVSLVRLFSLSGEKIHPALKTETDKIFRKAGTTAARATALHGTTIVPQEKLQRTAALSGPETKKFN